MGVTTASNASPATMAANIKKISTGYTYKEVSVDAKNWVTSLTFKSTDYGVPTDKCVMMYYAIYNMRNGAGDTDTYCQQSYGAGILSVSFTHNQARTGSSKVIIIYKDEIQTSTPSSPSTGSGVTIRNYKVYFNCAASGYDATGISRYAYSQMTLDVSGYNNLVLGSYTLSYDSDHSSVGNDNATLTCTVDGVSHVLSASGTGIDVSNASEVSFKLNLNNASVGAGYGVWGSVNISSITLS